MMKTLPRVIVSPVGISLFFNSLNREEDDLRRRLNQHSNDPELPDALSDEVETLSFRAQERLAEGSVSERRRLSAELNGLYGFYDNQMQPNQDIHILIATDTALGRKAAQIIQQFLQNGIGFANVQIIHPPGLHTASVADFSHGIKDLLNTFENLLPGYAENGYEIIFNLTGGFKSLQGYLTIIGMFYADQIVYIFERSDELLRIPRLPLKIDEETLARHADELALLAAGGVYPRAQLHVSEALLDVDERGDAMISDWGQLVWNRIKKSLLSKELLKFPYLEYENTFRKDFRNADPNIRIALQETLAQVSVLLQESNGNIAALKKDSRIRYDEYSGQSSSSAPIGHFRIDVGNRVTCVFVNGRLHLRHFGSHDYTEQKEGIR